MIAEDISRRCTDSFPAGRLHCATSLLPAFQIAARPARPPLITVTAFQATSF